MIRDEIHKNKNVHKKRNKRNVWYVQYGIAH